MDIIETNYKKHCVTHSDIHEHLPTLVEYAKLCDNITEMGVRWGSSTWALLYANPKKLISYDVVRNEQIEEIIEISKKFNLNFFEFIQKDVLSIEIQPTELLFIDTLHTYNQLTQELNLHAEKVSKYIILHDTESFGFSDEYIYEHASSFVKKMDVNKQGLWPAVSDFLMTNEGKNWSIEKKFTNNNGLTILKRNKK